MRSFFKNLLKQDPLQPPLSKLLLFSESPTTLNLPPLLSFYHTLHSSHNESPLLQYLLLQLQKRKPMLIKLKIFLYLFSISKLTTFDISELITRKKLKLFSQQYSLPPSSPHPPPLTLFDLSLPTRDPYLHKYLLLPFYNYMIKLSTNEELYKTCYNGTIPSDDIFRKGPRIRYIWVFKIFNLLNLLIPLLSPLLLIIDKYPKETIFVEILRIVRGDIVVYWNFVTMCMEETAGMNVFLMPYGDCLQYYECVREYRMWRGKNERLLQEVEGVVGEKQREKEKEKEIRYFEVGEEREQELEMLALRIQLISGSLKSGEKRKVEGNEAKGKGKQEGYQRMVTEYNEKMGRYETRLKTLEN